MAKASSSAQHYVECDNCEENAAKFLCKTCVGNLCEPCQSEHLKKKITKNHEIVSLTSHDDMVDVFYCTEHTKKKLECYCNRCRKPVCTDCIIHSHNGHSVKHLSTVYKEIKDLSIRQKDEIDNIIIPKYYGLLVNEMEKRTAFTERADEIQNKIDGHTQSVVEMVKRIGQQTVGHLRKAEKDGLGEMDNFKENIEGTINQLQLMSKVIFEKLEAKPHISIFDSITGYNLAMFRVLPSPTEYTLTDFQPQNLEKELNFGNPPLLQSYKETALSYWHNFHEYDESMDQRYIDTPDDMTDDEDNCKWEPQDHQLRMKEQQLKFQRRTVESEQYLKKAKNKKKVKK